MGSLNTHIHDGYDHGRIARLHLRIVPDGEQSHIGAGQRVGQRTVVVVVPLILQLRIVEGHLALVTRPLAAGRLLRGGLHLRGQQVTGLVHQLYGIDRFHVADLGQGSKIRGRTRYGHRIVELHVIPQVQAVTAMPGLETGIRREYAPYLRSAQFGCQPIEFGVTRAELSARKDAHPKRRGLLGHLDTHPSGEHIAVGILVRISSLRRYPLLRILPHAGSKQAGRRQ